MASSGIAAQYEAALPSRHKGNPLIEALPRTLSEEELTDRLIYLPKVEASDCLLPPDERRKAMGAIFDVFVPQEFHFNLCRTLDFLIREGYVSRNPCKPATLSHSHFIATGEQYLGTSPPEKSTAKTIFVNGLSRLGKTRAILRYLVTCVPPVIQHERYEGKPLPLRQVTWLYVRVPKNASLKEFALAFFEALDRVLDTSEYSKRASRERGDLARLFSKVCREVQLGLLVVDELQNLLNARTQGKESVQKFLHSLVDLVGIPVVFVGTYKAHGVFLGTLQETARISGLANPELLRLDPSNDEWHVLVEAFWSCQWTTTPTPLDEKLRETLYDVTLAVTELIPNVLFHAQSRLLQETDGDRQITGDLLRDVMKTELKTWVPALNALRANNAETYEDLIAAGDLVNKITKTIADKTLTNTVAALVKRELAQMMRAQGVPSEAPSTSAVEIEIDPLHVAEDPRDLRNAVAAKSPLEWLEQQGHLLIDIDALTSGPQRDDES
jgi:hypothetical protein